MTSILQHLTKRLNVLKSDREREILRLKKFMQKYLFLFNTNIYTDAHEYSYKDVKELWYVSIYYYPSTGTCSITTGTIDYSKHLTGQVYQADKIPDATKITEAFKRSLEATNRGTKKSIGYMESFREIMEKVEI